MFFEKLFRIVFRKPSIVSRIVLWAAAVSPSFTSRWGVVHANVGQKLVKRNKITSLPDVQS
jgi:hypothetical protein